MLCKKKAQKTFHFSKTQHEKKFFFVFRLLLLMSVGRDFFFLQLKQQEVSLIVNFRPHDKTRLDLFRATESLVRKMRTEKKSMKRLLVMIIMDVDDEKFMEKWGLLRSWDDFVELNGRWRRKVDGKILENKIWTIF